MARTVEKRKAAGETQVRWDGPDHVKFELARRDNPSANVRFQQIEPVKTDNIPHKSLLQLDTWEKLVQHLATSHWNGHAAKYRVYIYDNSNWQKASCEVCFDEREERETMPNGQQPPGGQGYLGMPNFPMQGMQGFPQQQMMNPWAAMSMMNPWAAMMGMPVQQQQAPQPVQQPQQQQVPQQQMPFPYPPVQGSIDPNMVNMLLALTRENAALVEETRRAAQSGGQLPAMPMMTPQMLMMMMTMCPWMFGMAPNPQQQQQPQKPPEPTKPEPPPDPMTQAMSAISMMSTLNKQAKRFAQEFADPEPEPPPAPAPDDDKLPHIIKELPHMRAVFDRATGAPVDGITMAMYNGDKLADGLRGMLKEARGLVKDLTDERKRAKQQDVDIETERKQREMHLKEREVALGQAQLQQQEQALQQGERMAELTKTMTNLGIHPDGQGQPQQPVQPSSPNGSGEYEPQ